MATELARLAYACTRADLIAVAANPAPASPEQSDAPAEKSARSPAATLRLDAPSLRAPSCRAIAPGPLFIQLLAAARACLALEARLEAGDQSPSARTTASRAQTATALRADPRRRPLRDAFAEITRKDPDRREILRETIKEIDTRLAADPAQTKCVAELIVDTCHHLNIIIDPAVLWDPLLDLLAEYCEPNGIPREDITCIKPPDPGSYCPPGFEDDPPAPPDTG